MCVINVFIFGMEILLGGYFEYYSFLVLYHLHSAL